MTRTTRTTEPVDDIDDFDPDFVKRLENVGLVIEVYALGIDKNLRAEFYSTLVQFCLNQARERRPRRERAKGNAAVAKSMGRK